jgi:hypothetical protein
MLDLFFGAKSDDHLLSYFLRLVGIPRRIPDYSNAYAGWNVSPSPPTYFLGTSRREAWREGKIRVWKNLSTWFANVLSMVVTGTLQKILMRMSYGSADMWRAMEWFAAICCCFRVQLLYKHKSLIELESQEGFDLSLWSFQPFIFLKYLRTD